MYFPQRTSEKTTYCEYWRHNAQNFAQQRCYAWMASQLAFRAPKRILDIGCGTGEGIAALLKASVREIVGLEENLDCIKAAEETLTSLGHRPTVTPRLGYDVGADGRHDLLIQQDIPIIERGPVTLVHADPFLCEVDLPLKDFLKSTKKFDAVTMWLIGTFESRRTCRTLDVLQINHPSDYRRLLQRVVYVLADQVLAPNGVLHIVDRGVIPNEQIKKGALAIHKEHAVGTSLIVSDFNFLPYNEAEGKRMSMTAPCVPDDSFVDDGRRAMHSLIVTKVIPSVTR